LSLRIALCGVALSVDHGVRLLALDDFDVSRGRLGCVVAF
jgi:hypothetical protein